MCELELFDTNLVERNKNLLIVYYIYNSLNDECDMLFRYLEYKCNYTRKLSKYNIDI